jgi:hypothetical protein
MKLNWILISGLLIFSTALMSSCGNPMGSQTEFGLGHHPGVPDTQPKAKGVGTEFVPSSLQLVSTTSSARFKVLSGVSNGPQSLKTITTGRGYKFYSNVQGSVVSYGEP